MLLVFLGKSGIPHSKIVHVLNHQFGMVTPASRCPVVPMAKYGMSTHTHVNAHRQHSGTETNVLYYPNVMVDR